MYTLSLHDALPISLVRKAEGQGLPLAFCSLGPLVTEIFEVAGFFDILKAYPGRGEALKALGGPKA
jgi:hypothetical protein